MKIKDLGPFAVFRLGGRVWVKSSGMLQVLDRSGTLFEPHGCGPTMFQPDTEVEPFDFTAPRPGQNCPVCFGGGYEPGAYNDNAHGGGKKRCRHGCLVEGKPDPVVEPAKETPVCAGCARPLAGCEQGGKAEKAGVLIE